MAGTNHPDHDSIHARARGQPSRPREASSPEMTKWRAYGLLLFMLLYTPFLLWADARWSSSVFWQLPLGALTFAVLAAATIGLPATQRRQVWLLVAMATVLEVTASPILGLYRYRFGDVPLYVPPGHGLVYLCPIGVAATPLGVEVDQPVAGWHVKRHV